MSGSGYKDVNPTLPDLRNCIGGANSFAVHHCEGVGQYLVPRSAALIHTVRSDDRSTPGKPLHTVHQYNTSVAQSVVDELARRRQIYEQVRIVDILDWYAEVLDSRCWVVCRNRLPTQRHDMCDTPIRKRARGDGSVEAIRH